LQRGLVRLKKRADFLRVAGRRQRVARPGFVLQAALSPPDIPGGAVRVGFTASRKVGNAVMRNRAKRRLRAAADEVLPKAGGLGTDYVLIARAGGTVAQPFAELVGDLAAAVRQIARRDVEGQKPRRPREEG
jgi:ribonuclease P protein component